MYETHVGECGVWSVICDGQEINNRGKVCVYTTLPKTHMREHIGYVVVVTFM